MININGELWALLAAFSLGGVLQLMLRQKAISALLPVGGVYSWLGYLEAHRPSTGGGASFYILIQIAVSIAAVLPAITGLAMAEKYFPDDHAGPR